MEKLTEGEKRIGTKVLNALSSTIVNRISKVGKGLPQLVEQNIGMDIGLFVLLVMKKSVEDLAKDFENIQQL